jgi:alanine-glyoxylate transaminase/serine-glyoxylate transaminase/serine-pyruvate transaminase
MSNFYPSVRTLMGPGPSDVHPRVLQALSMPTIGHLDPEFQALMEEIKSLLQYAFQTENKLTIPVSAPGSAGMETCFVNLIEPGDEVLVCINGVFGKRMLENVERAGGVATVIEDDWGKPVNPQKVEDALNKNSNIKIVAFVHAETSTGVLSDAEAICKLAKAYDTLTIVDTVTSLAGSPLKVDEWKMDAVYSGTQKCLSCIPGISPVTFSDTAIEKIKNRKTKVQSWFLDLNLVMGYWDGESKRSYHHTAPVNSLYALYESLKMLKEEGLESSWSRHKENSKLLQVGLEELGFEYLVDEEYRIPQLNAVTVPAGIDEAKIRTSLLNQYSLEIGAGLGPLAGKIWRIGLMGNSSNKRNVSLCLSALTDLMGK